MDKVLFLDIDGVLNSERYFLERHAVQKALKARGEPLPPHRMADDLDSRTVPLLNSVLVKTGCEVVLSSTWRKLGLDSVNQALKEKGFADTIRFRTAIDNKDRGLQINQFIDEYNVQHYLVVDDEKSDIIPHLPENLLIKTTWKQGLMPEHCEKIVSYFSTLSNAPKLPLVETVYEPAYSGSKLLEYEHKYGMPSEVFEQKFKAGEIETSRDFLNWIYNIEMNKNTKKV